MIAPVKAPAAAPAAAPIDAARTWPVAAPPMIAPVAAPHAAPWPTGVSHDVRMPQLNAIAKLTVGMVVRMIRLVYKIEPRITADVAGASSRGAYLAEPILGVYKYSLNTHVENQPA